MTPSIVQTQKEHCLLGNTSFETLSATIGPAMSPMRVAGGGRLFLTISRLNGEYLPKETCYRQSKRALETTKGPYSLPIFHELSFPNCWKQDLRIYPPSLNVVFMCCFFASLLLCQFLQREVTEQSLAKFCDMLGNFQKIWGVPSLKIGELKLPIVGRFSTRQNYSRCRQIGLRAVFTHPRKRSLWLRCQQNKLRWRCIANVNETVEITSLVSQGLKTVELAMASRWRP